MLAYTRDMDRTKTPQPTTPTGPYNPTQLLKNYLLLLGLLLGLTLWLGGWQPHTSDSLLGWSTGTIHVTEGTDGDTGAHPLDPHDEGVRPAPDTLPVSSSLSTSMSSSLDTAAHPVEMGGVFFEGSGPAGVSISPWSGGSQA